MPDRSALRLQSHSVRQRFDAGHGDHIAASPLLAAQADHIRLAAAQVVHIRIGKLLTVRVQQRHIAIARGQRLGGSLRVLLGNQIHCGLDRQGRNPQRVDARCAVSQPNILRRAQIIARALRGVKGEADGYARGLGQGVCRIIQQAEAGVKLRVVRIAAGGAFGDDDGVFQRQRSSALIQNVGQLLGAVC